MSEQGSYNNKPRSLFLKAGSPVYSGLPCLESSKQQQASGEADNIVSTLQNEVQITPAKIEHMVKEFKTHRCAMDFDGAFIKSVMVKKEDQ